LKKDYNGKYRRQDSCYTIGGMKTSSEKFRFKNNELVRIELHISFTSDKKTHEKKKKIGGYPNLISQKQINEYKEMLVNALKKKYQLTYEGKYRENEQIMEDVLVLGNGQLSVLFKQNKTYSYLSIILDYMTLGKDQKDILDYVESIKKG